MTERDDQVQNSIDKLAARVDALQQQLDKLNAVLLKLDDIYTANFDILHRERCGAFERIKNIELFVFPHLRADISELNDILGEGDPELFNPLDRRK
jgi:hypothetical protein